MRQESFQTMEIANAKTFCTACTKVNFAKMGGRAGEAIAIPVDLKHCRVHAPPFCHEGREHRSSDAKAGHARSSRVCRYANASARH
jgi:hypothetical protein